MDTRTAYRCFRDLLSLTLLLVLAVLCGCLTTGEKLAVDQWVEEKTPGVVKAELEPMEGQLAKMRIEVAELKSHHDELRDEATAFDINDPITWINSGGLGLVAWLLMKKKTAPEAAGT